MVLGGRDGLVPVSHLNPSDSGLSAGQRVIAMMGGMGRSFDGSYAEYALIPSHHVFPVDTGMPWDLFAAVPETYYTAWGSLRECLRLQPEDTLLIRGATCALGYAAICIAKGMGCRVVATIHRESSSFFSGTLMSHCWIQAVWRVP